MHVNIRYPALASGLLFAATAAIDIPHHQPNPFEGPLDYLLEATFSAGWACGALALWLLAKASANVFARVGWSLAGLGYTALTVVTAGTAINGGDVLDPVFVVALLSIALGSLTLFFTDVLGRVRPKGAGIVALVALVSMIALGEGYGLLGWSAGWFAIAALTRTAQSVDGQSDATTTSTRWNSLSSV
jgi:hypothetical protein